jgi:hypothetical protein
MTPEISPYPGGQFKPKWVEGNSPPTGDAKSNLLDPDDSGLLMDAKTNDKRRLERDPRPNAHSREYFPRFAVFHRIIFELIDSRLVCGQRGGTKARWLGIFEQLLELAGH